MKKMKEMELEFKSLGGCFDGVSEAEKEYVLNAFKDLKEYEVEFKDNLDGYKEYLNEYETGYTDDSYELKEEQYFKENYANCEHIIYKALDRGVSKELCQVLAGVAGVIIPELDDDYKESTGGNLEWKCNEPELLAVGYPKYDSNPLEFTIERGAEGCYMLIEQKVDGFLRGIEIDCIPSVTEGIELAESCLEHKIPLFWHSPNHEYDGEEYLCVDYTRVELKDDEYVILAKSEYIDEVIIDDDYFIEDEILLEDYEPFSRDVMEEEIWKCSNGTIKLKGSEYAINEVHTWIYELSGALEFVDNTWLAPQIELDESGIFHIFGDCNDGKYTIIDGQFVHHTPAKTYGCIDVECDEDGSRVWRNFEDFEVEVEFHIQ